MNTKNISPKAQHAKQAEAILARRAKRSDNETEEMLAIHEDEETEVLLDDVEVPETEVGEYDGLGKKELRLLCQERKLVFKKKDTIEQLLAILEAE